MKPKPIEVDLKLLVEVSELEYAIENELDNYGYLDEGFLKQQGYERTDLIQRFLADTEVVQLILKNLRTEIIRNISVENYLEDTNWIEDLLSDPGHWSNELNDRCEEFQEAQNIQHQIQREMEAERNLKNAIWLLKEHGYRVTAPKK